MAMENKRVEAKLRTLGVALIKPEDGLAFLHHLSKSQRGWNNVVVANLNWARVIHSSGQTNAFFYSEVNSTLSNQDLDPGNQQKDFGSYNQMVGGKGDLHIDISKVVHDVLGSIIGVPVDEKAPLLSLGLDSLAASEVHSAFERKFGISLPSTLVFDHPTVNSIVQLINSIIPVRPKGRWGGTNASVNDPNWSYDDIVEMVGLRVEKVMGTRANIHVPLMQLGLDSLAAGQLHKELSDAISIEIPTTTVFDYPTVASMAQFIWGHLYPSDPKARKELGSSMAVVQNSNTNMSLVGQPINPNGPTLTKTGYFTVPSIKRLQRMSDSELREVPRFVIGRQGLGEIAFLYPVDLLGANLNEIVHIDRGSVVLYPENRPQLGQGLNRPALLSFKKVFPRGKKTKYSLIAFKSVLLQACSRMGATFVHWDPDEGVWIAKVDGFFF